MSRLKPQELPIYNTMFCMLAAFLTYCSMYAFRKPISSGVFQDLQFWGVDYKILLITAQAIGYTISKFVGIKLISELKPAYRIPYILVFIGIAWSGLFLFGVLGYPWGLLGLLINGLPLGMIWGLVFSFLEGRRNTELLGVGMAVSFIVASGLVKSVGRYLIDTLEISEYWMPFGTGLFFLLPLGVGIAMLRTIKPPGDQDIALRTQRVPMDGKQRMLFFKTFAPGIVLLVGVYVALTIFRDLRDNFSVEIWTGLGYPDSTRLLSITEIPIAILVFIIVASMVFVKNNKQAFLINIGIIILGGALMILSTFLFRKQVIGSIFWMISIGFAMYLAYISYHTMLFERWIAAFKYQSNIGFLMYLVDSFGYLGSVGILFIKNYTDTKTGWLPYVQSMSIWAGTAIMLMGLGSLVYFVSKLKSKKETEFQVEMKAEWSN